MDDALKLGVCALLIALGTGACGSSSKCGNSKCGADDAGGSPAAAAGQSASQGGVTGGSGGSSAGSAGRDSSSGSSGKGPSSSSGGSAAGSAAANAGTSGKGTSGAGGASGGSAGNAGAASGAGGAAAGVGGGAGASGGALKLMSTAFADGTKIDTKYRCMAPSPDLQWSGAPSATKSFAVILKDVTPGFSMGFYHWVIYDIDPMTTSLTENVPIGYAPAMPAGAHQAAIWNGTIGFNGPCGPTGTNMYELTLYALDTASLGLTMSSTGDDVQMAVDQHKLASAKLSITSSAM